ncbi:MAG: GNAT family N-acetyltransferase [Bacteroidales bacterium]|nr:GNAT family N-acetyltransferase [Bacteroidales bacterium]
MSELFIIRPAEPRDLEAVNTLLGQVLAVHHAGRPDLFRPVGKKYTDEELLSIFENPDTPVFVYEKEGRVLGYAFCVLRYQESGALMPIKTLYVDDLCVLDSARGLHIGTALFDYVKSFAKKNGCYNITLHVWEGNSGAKAFYETQGMTPQYTSMELLCK